MNIGNNHAEFSHN